MSNLKYKVAVSGFLSEDKALFELRMQTEDGSPLDPQIILDALGDYLLVDPNGLFTDIVPSSIPPIYN